MAKQLKVPNKEILPGDEFLDDSIEDYREVTSKIIYFDTEEVYLRFVSGGSKLLPLDGFSDIRRKNIPPVGEFRSPMGH